MSSGLSLLHVEYKPGQWYWIRQNGSCPVECWDWREHDPDIVGPFPTYEASDADHYTHERNTGGSCIEKYDPKRIDPVLDACIARAKTPADYRRPFNFKFGRFR